MTSLLSAISRHGHRHHHRRHHRRIPFPFPSSAVLPPSNNFIGSLPHSTDETNNNYNGDDEHHRLAVKKQRPLHLNHNIHLNSCASVPTPSTYRTTRPPLPHCHHYYYQQQQQQSSYYHTTTRKEILPFLVVGGLVGITAMYTYKTFQQIDADWENYYKEVAEYKAKTGIDLESQDDGTQQQQQQQHQYGQPRQQDNDASTMSHNGAMNTSLSTFFTGGILAIDMGTRRLKLSHCPHPRRRHSNAANTSPSSSPTIIVDREGYRYTPSLVWIPPLSSSSSSSDNAIGQDASTELVVSGRMAEARLYDVKEGQTLPLQDMLDDGESSSSRSHQEAVAIITQTLRTVACNALDQVLGGSSRSSSSNNNNNNKNPLFVLDESLATTLSGCYNVRPIVTYPISSSSSRGGLDVENNNDGNQSDFTPTQYYQRAISNLTSPVGIAAYVPEPIAIVTGAEYFNLLPPKDNNNSILVVDVGGTTTCISLVRGGGTGGDQDDEKEIVYSASLPFGGDTFIDLLVSYLVHDFYGQQCNTEKEENDSTESSMKALSTRPKLNDPTALQRLHEASTTAIHELSNKTRSEINVPYLTMDIRTLQPRHLKLGVSRNIVNVEMETWIRNKLVPYLMMTKNQETNQQNPSMCKVLSSATPPPTNFATLFSSTIMCALEQTSYTPYMLRAILVVGGGARIPLVREAMKEGVGYLAGEAYAVGSGSGGKGKKLIMPEGEMCDEISVLGAAVWGSVR